jgi:hypothetical protein
MSPAAAIAGSHDLCCHRCERETHSDGQGAVPLAVPVTLLLAEAMRIIFASQATWHPGY